MNNTVPVSPIPPEQATYAGVPVSAPVLSTPPAPCPVPAAEAMPPRTKNKFLTFLFALIPGAGAMYHGLLKRGISLMALFALIIAIAAFLYLPVVTFVLPIIWFYSFFDTVNRMNTPLEELRDLPDGYLFITPPKGADDAASPVLQRLFGQRHLFIGWFLVLFSIWLALKLMFDWSMGYYFYELLGSSVYNSITSIINRLPSLILPVFCIVIGIKLIVGKPNKKPSYDEYTIPTDDHQTR